MPIHRWLSTCGEMLCPMNLKNSTTSTGNTERTRELNVRGLALSDQGGS